MDTQRKLRFLAEKVVHHPTVLAAHVEGLRWTADADLEVKSKFWGRCIELKPVAYIQVRSHAMVLPAIVAAKCHETHVIDMPMNVRVDRYVPIHAFMVSH